MSQPGNAPTSKPSDCGWTRGTYYAGHMAYHATTQDAAALDFATAWASLHNYTCGGLWQDPNNIACGLAFADLYDLAPADYKLALAVTMDHSVQRWVGYDWWWVDTLFMGLASMIRYANRTGDPRLLDTALMEYADTTHGGKNTSQPGLWDPASNLYWRDHTYIAQREPNGAKVFWARGNGWAIAAHALALAALPAGHPAAAELTARLLAMSNALVPLQGSDGMWRAALLDAAVDPNPETTGSSAFTFAMAWGINAGLLSADAFAPIVEKAWAGLSTVALQPNGLVGWCQPPNGQPAPSSQNSTSDFVRDWLCSPFPSPPHFAFPLSYYAPVATHAVLQFSSPPLFFFLPGSALGSGCLLVARYSSWQARSEWRKCMYRWASPGLIEIKKEG
jgi:unsaturated rhamnogalacturonyl hydrolase